MTKKPNKEGIYVIAMCVDGLWEDIVIDDHIPCSVYRDQQGRYFAEPLYNRTKNDETEMWVCFLEKAWAKIFKGYENIVGGFMEEALRDLTGAPCKSFYTRLEQHSDEELWRTICDAE